MFISFSRLFPARSLRPERQSQAEHHHISNHIARKEREAVGFIRIATAADETPGVTTNPMEKRVSSINDIHDCMHLNCRWITAAAT